MTVPQVVQDLVLITCTHLKRSCSTYERYRKAPLPMFESHFDTMLTRERRIAAERETAMAEQEKRKKHNRTRYMSARLAAIDLAVLEAAKNESGFKNVVRNGTGWRAWVSVAGKTIQLRTHREPVFAAHERYLYMKERAMPYGAEAKELAAQMTTKPADAEDETLAVIRSFHGWAKGTSGYDDESFQAEIERIRIGRALAEAEAKGKLSGRPRKRVEVYPKLPGTVVWIQDEHILIETQVGDSMMTHSYSPLSEIKVRVGDVVDGITVLGVLVGAKTKLNVFEIPPVGEMRRSKLSAEAKARMLSPADPAYGDAIAAQMIKQPTPKAEPKPEVAAEPPAPPPTPSLTRAPKIVDKFVPRTLTPEQQALADSLQQANQEGANEPEAARAERLPVEIAAKIEERKQAFYDQLAERQVAARAAGAPVPQLDDDALVDTISNVIPFPKSIEPSLRVNFVEPSPEPEPVDDSTAEHEPVEALAPDPAKPRSIFDWQPQPSK